jgi:Domain of unknown function (DUF4062)
MAHFVKKRLQVFVSSTFLDLKDERQAAVKAILEAGHIPAGMELFTSGDESQLEVIKQWIEASDVYLLILGGRYGSLEEKSNKGYTQIEYEYAMELKKPLFACVMKEDYLDEKIRKDERIANKDIYEQNSQEKFKEFKKLVMSKIVFQCSSFMEIENAVLKKMNEFERNTDLIGWIRASESTDSVLLSEEVARLSKENHELREYVNILNNQIQISSPDLMMHGFSFSEILEILNKSLLSEQDFINDFRKEFSDFNIESLDSGRIEGFLIKHLKSGEILNLTDFAFIFSDILDKGVTLTLGISYELIIFNSPQIKTIFDVGILESNSIRDSEKQSPVSFTRTVIRTTSNGSSFIKYLKIKMLKEKMLLA